MEFITNYGLFVIKLMSVVVAILILIAGIIATVSKGKKCKGKLDVKQLNKKYEAYRHTFFSVLGDTEEIKRYKKEAKQKKKKENKIQRRIFVIDFHGDVKASSVQNLRETITAVLLVAKPEDEVLVRLESAGGLVNAYGLAASQLQRVKSANIKLTISVDKIAASGGYMMACVADHLIASPFSIIGSIGVIAQCPNFHRYLKNKSIDFEQVTAGKFKRTLTVFGENTEEGRKKLQAEINETHNLFKSFIQKNRRMVDVSQVATGEYWYGTQALDLQLVDELKTSDDYLLSACKKNDLYEINYHIKKSLPQRLAHNATNLIYNAIRHNFNVFS